MEHSLIGAQSCAESAFEDPQSNQWVRLESLLEESENIGGMVVCSDQLRGVLKTITRLSPYRQTVLIGGESGTGKELIARALHNYGTAPNGPFVTFNCSNLVESLAESQLFGHVRGAFTDAREESLGYFRSANGGTLFLDEVGELPLKLQPKLLRAVENHEVQPVGSSHNYKVNIRLVAATNRDLLAMVKAGEFREDLYYRLHSAAIMVPPLRDRPVAIPCFVAHFVATYNKLFGKHIEYISSDALVALSTYRWPGNIRELSHVIETSVLMTDSDRITIADLPAQVTQDAEARPVVIVAQHRPFGDPTVDQIVQLPARLVAAPALSASEEGPLLLDDVIKKTLLRSLQHTAGNRRRAADLLGVSRSTLYRMLARYGLDEVGRPRGMELENGLATPC
jgi:two-component system response regulator HydG